ncbi:MAG: ABC transporter ATP-binding protein, partial [Deltaproteobacteria bacterium]
MHLLEVKNLITRFKTDAGIVRAVDGISYFVDEGEIIGLVGESGCGKSVSQLSILQLIPTPPGEIASGEAFFAGQNLLRFHPKGAEMRGIRGGKISIIFQEPMTSLNPVLTVSRQLTEMMELHLRLDRKSSRERAVDLLRMVGIPDAEKRFSNFPYQFSGGMRQ